MSDATRFIPVSEWANHYPWPTPGSLRAYICNAEKRVRTGEGKGDPLFLECVVRVGSRVLIDEMKFVAWVDSQNVGNGTHASAA